LNLLAALALPAAAVSADGPLPPRSTISVIAFDTDRTGWVPPSRFGATIADLVTDRLVRSGRFRVLDREWSLGLDLPHDPEAREALRMRAQQRGVDFLVVGSVTRFTTETDRRRLGAFALSALGGLGRSKTESVVGLTLRVIAVRSGEIVTATTSTGAASRRRVGAGGLGVVHGVPFAGGFSSSSDGIREPLIDEALVRAVDALETAFEPPAGEPIPQELSSVSPRP
jgi:curli biogenesis system outer membrane secretion channel CsgG